MACSLVTKYLTNNSKITEVNLSLKHFNQDEKGETKLKVSEFFRLKIKELGFKSKSTSQAANGRFTIYSFRKSGKGQEEESESFKRLNTGQLIGAKATVQYVIISSDAPIIYTGFSKGSSS